MCCHCHTVGYHCHVMIHHTERRRPTWHAKDASDPINVDEAVLARTLAIVGLDLVASASVWLFRALTVLTGYVDLAITAVRILFARLRDQETLCIAMRVGAAQWAHLQHQCRQDWFLGYTLVAYCRCAVS
jgi:hypothetical protein